MYRFYLTKSGKIRIWYNDLGIATLVDHQGHNRKNFRFDPDSQDPVIMIRGEIIHLNNFLWDPLDKMLRQLGAVVACGDRLAGPTSDEVLATFLKESDKLGFLIDARVCDAIIPEMGIGIYGDKTVKVVVKPVEGRYPKNMWGYKMEMTPVREDIRGFVANESYYFSDLISLIKSGRIQVVNLDNLSRTELKLQAPIGVTIL